MNNHWIKMEIPKITLCIPTYNRFDNFLSVNIPKYLQNPFIDEIVISDETGEDIQKIGNAFPNESRLKLYQNETRLGPFLNKEMAVKRASNDWVCLMDSDNFAPVTYFDAWANYIRANGINNRNIYVPSQTSPQANHPGFNFSKFNNHCFDKKNINTYDMNDSAVTTMLNTGNYIFHKENFLGTSTIYPDLHSKLDIQDVFFKNALLLIHGSTLHIVPNMIYDHIVHSGSFFINNSHNFHYAHNIVRDIYRTIN